MIELLMDPHVWVGLATLVVLEIVLGIDNLIFIAILADKLPRHQRDKARVVGLSLALVMRLGLLTMMSWLITLTTPLFSVLGLSFSGRDLILLLGGLFLLFKATTELHERLEGVNHGKSGSTAHASFGIVVTQIVILDAVFSLDAVITAVGMVDHLPVMMAAVVISIGVMLLASKPLTRFVNAHPTVVVLCLSFLLMIGLSLVAEGLGFHLPKGYLYAAIGFSIVIEFFNQLARRNLAKQEARRPLRERTAESILRLLGSRPVNRQHEDEEPSDQPAPELAFDPQERIMVSGVLSLAERNVRSIMTHRADISWIDVEDDPQEIRQMLMESTHSMFPVCRGNVDEIIGVGRSKDLLAALTGGPDTDIPAALEKAAKAPLYVPETTSVINLIDLLRQSRGMLSLVVDEYGMVEGVVTPMDVMEAIAGEFPDEDDTPQIQPTGENSWLVAGTADLHRLEQVLETRGIVDDSGDYSSMAGFLLAQFGYLPKQGETLQHNQFEYTVEDADGLRIKQVSVRRLPRDEEPPPG